MKFCEQGDCENYDRGGICCKCCDLKDKCEYACWRCDDNDECIYEIDSDLENNEEVDTMKVIGTTGLSNYYGEVEVVEKNGKYYLTLENYDTLHGIEIPELLARMIVIECDGGKKEINMWENN